MSNQRNPDDLKKNLTEMQFYVTQNHGTEPPFTGRLLHNKRDGVYHCLVCDAALFHSQTKYDSGCGWPSFFEPISKTSLIEAADNSLGMRRIEVMCGRCKSHLGHVFDDGPPPTGLRYCINGVVLDFEKAKTAEKKYNKKKVGNGS